MTMKLTTAQHDRAAGVLLGLASGDALGVPYEFAQPPAADQLAEMTGGGLGNFAPGEWSDDTSMAVCIAEVAASGADLTTVDALDAIAEGFLRWHASGPADIGIQTSAVLGATRRRLDAGERGTSSVMASAAAEHARLNPRSAGNGALMRTAPVALAHLDDQVKTARAAALVARLTHGDPLAAESCILWSEAIRVAVLEGRIDFTAGIDLLPPERRHDWEAWLDEATEGLPARFTPNGFTVTALQAAAAAIHATAVPELDPGARRFPCLHLQDALHAAVRIGNDTDTVAAIAGGLLGARWGASAVPWRWRRAVHGWPGRAGRDLVSLGTLAVRGGTSDPAGWPGCADVVYDEAASRDVVPHPSDAGVLLGTHLSRSHGASAVVAACRVGPQQACHDGAGVVVESRLMDRDDPADNPNLHFALHDAADAVLGLRREGHTVLLHCVAAEQRTPSIAIAYAVLLGEPVAAARKAVRGALASTRGHGCVWDAAGDGGR